MKQTLLSYLVITSIFASASGTEFQVNTRTSDDQTDAAIAMDADGNFVVVWYSYRQDGDKGGIFGQHFRADGSAIGDEFQINTSTTGHQKAPAVAMNSGGNFVVVWHGPEAVEANENDIFAQRFDPNAQLLGVEFRINTYTDGEQQFPSVSMNYDGNFVVVWESMNIPEDQNKTSICGRLYDRFGSSSGPEFVINDEPSTCRYPDVAMHNSGRFIVVWVRESTLKSVWVRHFEADGSAPYLSSRVNDDFNFTSLTRPSVTIDAIGNYVIVWDGHHDTYLEDDIYLKRYHWSHAPIHEQFLVNIYQPGAQSNPSVAMAVDGQFVVVWQSDTGSEDRKKDIFGQRFPSQGEHIGYPILIGDQFRMNTYTPDDQRYTAVAISSTSRFVTVWESDGQDGSGYGVFGEMGPRVGSADFTGDGLVNFRDYCVLAGDWLKEGNPLSADLVNDNRIDGQDLARFCKQWLTLCYECNEVDINSDDRIDFKDYAFWAANWLKQGPNLNGDITGNGVVDMTDLKALVFHWTDDCE